jgi:hypothetical protein
MAKYLLRTWQPRNEDDPRKATAKTQQNR